MMKRIVCILTTVSVILIASLAMADVAHWPDWVYDHNAQYASWDYWNANGSYDSWNEYTHDHNNGLSEPYYADYSWNIPPGPGYIYHESKFNRDGVIQPVTGEGLVFYFDNYDLDNPEKWVRVIINYHSTDDASIPVSVMGFDVWTMGGPNEQAWADEYYEAGEPVGLTNQGDGWIIAAYDFIIEPNPQEEWIEIIFDNYNGIYIDEVQIHTRCVPIPGALWLLGSGLLGLVAIRRRKGKE